MPRKTNRHKGSPASSATALREDRIESELVAAIVNQGKFAAIYNTKASPGESLPEGLIHSKTGFLLSLNHVKARIDEEKVKKEMEMLEKVAVIAYFVGGQQSYKILEEWLDGLGKEVQEDLKLGRDLGQGFF
jgi:hypothetical protein